MQWMNRLSESMEKWLPNEGGLEVGKVTLLERIEKMMLRWEDSKKIRSSKKETKA